MSRLNNWLAMGLGAPWLGHGRAVECLLAFVAALYAILLLTIPGAAYDSKATADIAWYGYGQVLVIPLALKCFLSGCGLIMNILGNPWSRPLRFLGAFFGTLIWTFLAAKFVLIGAIATVGFPFSVGALLFSVRIMGMALANLPRPGSPGQL